jgi:hypothetical protein
MSKKKDKQDAVETRVAMDGGPTVSHDELIAKIARLNEADSDRASDVGEQRQEIGEFLESTGINNVAFSLARRLLKMKESKARDVLLSLNTIIPMVEAHITGQGTPDMFTDEPSDAPREPVGDEDFEAALAAAMPEGEAQGYLGAAG